MICPAYRDTGFSAYFTEIESLRDSIQCPLWSIQVYWSFRKHSWPSNHSFFSYYMDEWKAHIYAELLVTVAWYYEINGTVQKCGNVRRRRYVYHEATIFRKLADETIWRKVHHQHHSVPFEEEDFRTRMKIVHHQCCHSSIFYKCVNRTDESFSTQLVIHPR